MKKNRWTREYLCKCSVWHENSCSFYNSKTKKPSPSTECKHYWEFQTTQWQNPMGLTYSSAPIEYAYLLCRECGEVRKTKVNEK